MAAVVDGAARFGLIVDGTEKLPLRRAHFGAGHGAARRGVEQKADYQGIALLYQEATELVEPKGPVYAWRRCSQDFGRLPADGVRVGGCVVVVQGGKVFLKLKGRVELCGPAKQLGQYYSLGYAKCIVASILLQRIKGKTKLRTSFSGIRGGPAAISEALVPG